MSDSSEDETKKITRVKKPMSEAKLKAVEKMKEGRRKQLAQQKKEREEKKETLKKDLKNTNVGGNADSYIKFE